MKKIFITSITGAQGSGIAKVFIDNGYEVSSLSRKEASFEGANIVVGEFSQKEVLAGAMKGCEAIILTLPLIFDSQKIVTLTQQIVDGAKEAGVSKIIYNTSIPLGDKKSGYNAIDVKHDGLKVLENSGLDIVTLMPTIYLENLVSPFLLPVIKENHIVPYPIANELEFSWISYENVGRYCLKAVEDDSIIGQKILITNKDNLSKQQITDLLAQTLGENLQYVPTSPEQFEENLKPILGEYVAKEIANLYRGVSENIEDFRHYTNKTFLNSVELQDTKTWATNLNLI